jgi:hypothetical protein
MRYSELTNIAPEIGPGRNPCDDVPSSNKTKRGTLRKTIFLKIIDWRHREWSAVRHLLAFRKSSFDHPHDGGNILERS